MDKQTSGWDRQMNQLWMVGMDEHEIGTDMYGMDKLLKNVDLCMWKIQIQIQYKSIPNTP